MNDKQMGYGDLFLFFMSGTMCWAGVWGMRQGIYRGGMVLFIMACVLTAMFLGGISEDE